MAERINFNDIKEKAREEQREKSGAYRYVGKVKKS